MALGKTGNHGYVGDCWDEADICDECWFDRFQMIHRQGREKAREGIAHTIMEEAKNFWADGDETRAEFLRQLSKDIKKGIYDE